MLYSNVFLELKRPFGYIYIFSPASNDLNFCTNRCTQRENLSPFILSLTLTEEIIFILIFYSRLISGWWHDWIRRKFGKIISYNKVESLKRHFYDSRIIFTVKSSKSQGVDDQCSSFKLPRIGKTWSGTSSVSETSGMCLPHFKTISWRHKKKSH